MDQRAREALRAAARAARRAFVTGLAAPVRAALEGQLAARLAPLLPPDAVVATYAATATEIDPAPLDPLLARPCFPRVAAGAGLGFHAAMRNQLRPGAHGIREPAEDAPQVTPAIVLVPLLLFDASGGRLGQGGGHYDRALGALRRAGPVLAIGLAWDMQESAPLPLAEWDERLDIVATPTRLIRCSAQAPPRPAGG